jgi:NADH:ubiquinone oxidoreductase subunit F (NADH-binding)/NADH:ubiquinone oxidoreductase subunit E
VSTNLVQLRRHKDDPLDHALARLQRVMEEKRAITEDDVVAIAKATRQPEAAVYGIATYYADLGVRRVGRTRVKVCKGTACFAACEDASVRWMERALGVREGETSADGSVSLEGVYCLGFCNAGPSVAIEGRVYGELTEEKAQALCRDLAGGAGLREAHEVHLPIFAARGGPAIVLERLAQPIDATKLEVARAHHVFAGLEKALSMKPEDVLAHVERSGLRGRGGAGFPTATKWRFMAEHAARAGEAWVVCNADEGDPGSYIDKYLMERDPFAILEGMAIAARATGANRGVIYVRSEYPRSAPALERAVVAARAAGWLGARVRGTDFAFDVTVVTGAGSYVCGEETALLRSVEGLRGMVTARPPFPAEKGLFGKPTIVNNVETLVNLGWIVRHGGDAYAAFGVGRSRGTKAVSVNERFARPGIYEVPLGTSLRAILEELAGGMKSGKRIKAVQVGGPLGGILPATMLDTPLGFEELDAVGALLGHGGIVAWDEDADMREVAVHLFQFCDAESCGKCFPCRIGGRRGLEIVKRLRAPRPRAEVEADVALLADLCETMRLGSLCAHGGAIPIPIASLMLHFRGEMLRGAT